MMATVARALVVGACLLAPLLFSPPLAAAEPSLRVIVHPRRAAPLSAAEVRAIYLKQKQLWADGTPIVPINREAGSEVREQFSQKIFNQDSRRLAGYWNQRYFEAGEFPPATLASDEAVIRFVTGNENAIGYVSRAEVGDSVVVVLELP